MSWKCPKCGRTFKKQDQPHYCGKPETVEEYIEAQEETVRPRLREIRDILRKALPEAEECISWSMPTYRKGRNIIHFAAAKKHIGIYPGGEATSKGTIRLPHDQEIPAALIDKIARWCYKEYSK